MAELSTAEIDYPVREPCFALKFLRLLHAAQAAKEIGRDACWLLTIIATTEDAIRYSGPARFWNEELMKACAFRSPKQLEAARDKAMEGGWLQYSRPAKRLIGSYAVFIPERVASLIGQSTGMLYQSPAENETVNQPVNQPTKERKNNRPVNRSYSGKPSIPSPSPIPNPKPVPTEFVLPERFNTPEVGSLLVSFAKHWESVNFVPLEQYRLEVLLMEAARSNADASKLCRWMGKCIANGKWINWFDPDTQSNGQPAAQDRVGNKPVPRQSHAQIRASQHRNKILCREIPADTPYPPECYVDGKLAIEGHGGITLKIAGRIA